MMYNSINCIPFAIWIFILHRPGHLTFILANITVGMVLKRRIILAGKYYLYHFLNFIIFLWFLFLHLLLRTLFVNYENTQGNWWRLVSVAVTDVRYDSLLWMCMLKTLTWTNGCQWKVHYWGRNSLVSNSYTILLFNFENYRLLQLHLFWIWELKIVPEQYIHASQNCNFST